MKKTIRERCRDCPQVALSAWHLWFIPNPTRESLECAFLVGKEPPLRRSGGGDCHLTALNEHFQQYGNSLFTLHLGGKRARAGAFILFFSFFPFNVGHGLLFSSLLSAPFHLAAKRGGRSEFQRGSAHSRGRHHPDT